VAELARSAHDHVRYIKREEARDAPPIRGNDGNEPRDQTNQDTAEQRREAFVNVRKNGLPSTPDRTQETQSQQQNPTPVQERVPETPAPVQPPTPPQTRSQ